MNVTSFLLTLFVLAIGHGAVRAATTEHRGIWMHPEQFKTPQLAEESIAKIAAAHLNAIYPLVWYRGGTAWFKSALGPMATDVSPGFDPLAHLVKVAHDRGIAVHAWFVNGSYGAPPARGLLASHPDWRLQDGAGETWYDLGKPAVRDFQRDLMLGCLREYDVDGLHFDYIRYSGQTVCFCEHCQNEFSQKTGHRPLRAGEERFPALIELASNPLSEPTTAQVLASFDDGAPAITINRLGEGEAVLLNWQAARAGGPALDRFAKTLLGRFGATATNIFLLHTAPTAAKYRDEEQSRALSWLASLGFPARRIDESRTDRVPRGGTLVLYGQYYIPDETTAWIENFVREGGHCLVVDGPVFAIKSAPLQRALGLRSRARYFRRATLVSPTAGQDIIEAGPAVDIEKERHRLSDWVTYRRETVTELVRAVSRGAKAHKPAAWLSAAVFFTRDRADAVCQDWYGWLREGCIDYVLPMAYTEDNATLAQAFEEWRASDPIMERIFPGLSLYSRKDGKAMTRDLALIRAQLDMCRANQTKGAQFFALSYLNESVVQLLATEVFPEPAAPWYPPRR